ncbi:hypothetical protein MMASJCM_1899 [Mycobacteroides abscessus subsp. massiliense CCUG 48898 = JCM 15300]|nr:hypothetical protein MMASJCM_1899 [Mycobacteroides abscessus subsp. massiliense CCUG 48898 = JCM 15300]
MRANSEPALLVYIPTIRAAFQSGRVKDHLKRLDLLGRGNIAARNFCHGRTKTQA